MNRDEVALPASRGAASGKRRAPPLRISAAARIGAALAVALAAMTAACPAGGGGSGAAGDAEMVPRSFWGRWTALDPAGRELYFSSTGLREGGGPETSATAAAADLVRLADGTSAVLESGAVLVRGGARYLRTASPSGVLRGALFDQSRLSAARPLQSGTAGLSGVSLTIVNVLNQEQRLQVLTGAGGAFSTPPDVPLIPGDQYAVALPADQGGATVVVTTPEPGGDAGVLTKTSLPYNLKLSYEFPAGSPRIYASGSANVGGSFYLAVANGGAQRSPAGDWEHEVEGSALGFHYYGSTALAAIEPGSSARIPPYDPVAADHGTIAVSRAAIEDDYVDERIIFRFRPRDGSGNAAGIWEDYASLRIYRRPAALWLYSKGAPVDALIVLPGENLGESLATAGVYGYAGLYRARVDVPYRSGKNYLIAVSGPAGTAFALGLDVAGIPFDAVDLAPAAAGTNVSEATARLLAYGDIAAGRLGSSPAFFRSDPTTIPATPALRVSPPGGAAASPLVFSFSPIAVSLGSYDAGGLLLSDAVILYSLDGSDPAVSGLSASGAAGLSLAAPASVRLRAFALKPGWAASSPLDLYYGFDLSAPSGATLGPWTERGAPAIQGQALLAIDDGSSVKRYRLGGGASLSEASDAFECFYFSAGGGAGEWMPLAPMPAPRTRHASVSLTVGGKVFIYALGGYNPGQTPNYRSEFFVYAMDSGSWSTASAPLPWAAEGLGACALDGRIYVAGGNHGSGDEARVARASPSRAPSSLGRIEAWEDGAVPDLGAARTGFGLAAVAAAGGGGWLFALGGEGATSVETLAVAADGTCAASWSDAGRSLPVEMPTVACAVHGSRLYVVGAPDGTVYRAEVDGATGELGPFVPDRPLLPARRYAAVAVAGGGSAAALVVAGGASGTRAAESFTWADMVESVIGP